MNLGAFLRNAAAAGLRPADAVTAPAASGDTSGATDDAQINAAMALAAASRSRRLRVVRGNYWTAGGIRHLAGVHVEFEPGVVIKMRGKITVAVTAINGSTLTLASVAGVKAGMHVSDALLTEAGFRLDGQLGGIPLGTVVGSVNVPASSITLVYQNEHLTLAGQPSVPTTGLAAGINLHPRANVWSTLSISDFSLRCPGGWAVFDGNWQHAYPFNVNSDDAFRNGLRQVNCSDFLIDGLLCRDSFYHGAIAVGGISGARVPRYRSENNGYRSMHMHSENTGGLVMPEIRDNYFGRMELVGDGHRAFYTRSFDENNSGLFLLLNNCINTSVQSVLARDQYGATFTANGGGSSWAGKWSRNLAVDSIIQERCGEGVGISSNVSNVAISTLLSSGKEQVVDNCVFHAEASSLRYYIDALGVTRSVKTRLITLPNQSGVGAIAALGLRPGLRCYASGGSTGASTIFGMLVWECHVGTGAGGADQIRVFRDDNGANEPYTTAWTGGMTIQYTKGAAIGFGAAAGETVNNVSIGTAVIQNAAYGVITAQATGTYRFNNIHFGTLTIQRGYRQGIDMWSVRNLHIGKLHTEDCASGLAWGGGGLSFDNFLQSCTGSIDNFSTTAHTGFTATAALRLDSECRALRITPAGLHRTGASQKLLDCVVPAGAGANSAGTSGPVVFVNPTDQNGAPLTVAAGHIVRSDAVTCLITRPTDAA